MLQKIIHSKNGVLFFFLSIVVVLSILAAAFYFFSPANRSLWGNGEVPLAVSNSNVNLLVILAKNDAAEFVENLPFLKDKITTIHVDITDKKQLFSKEWDKGLTFAGFDAKIDEKGAVNISLFLDAPLLKSSGWSTAAASRQVFSLFIESLMYLELSKNGIGAVGTNSDPSYQALFQQSLNEKTVSLVNKFESENKNSVFLVEYDQ